MTNTVAPFFLSPSFEKTLASFQNFVAISEGLVANLVTLCSLELHPERPICHIYMELSGSVTTTMHS
jgi:hypothetical protein